MKFLFVIVIGNLVFISCKQNGEVNIVYPEGGKPYLSNISARASNHYFLPEKESIPARDSFMAFDQKYSFEGFDEKNLSLSPPPKDIFRFTFGCGFCGKAAVILLTEKSIIIKKNKHGLSGINQDESLLDSIEKENYWIIKRYYPFTDTMYPEQYKKRYKFFFDSLMKIRPQLKDLSYFEKLRTKMSVVYKMPEGYLEEKIPISANRFKYFVDKLNKSGFWQRSYRNDCTNSPMDGDGFIVEAATKEKYHFVNHDYCQGDDDKSNLRKMINELLDYIHFDLQKFYTEDFPKKTN
jgi:hypothetical protein